MLEDNPDIGSTTGTVNPVVMECNDGKLNDIRGMHITLRTTSLRLVICMKNSLIRSSLRHARQSKKA